MARAFAALRLATGKSVTAARITQYERHAKARLLQRSPQSLGSAPASPSDPGQTVLVCPPKHMASALLSYAGVGR